MRLVDADKLFPDVMKVDGSMAISQGQLAYAHTVEAIPKAYYEARLKADMVVMLEDLKQDIIAEAYGIETDCSDYVVNVADIDKVIQQKIDKLKGEEDGTNEKTSD